MDQPYWQQIGSISLAISYGMHIYVKKYHMKQVALYFHWLLPDNLHHQFAKQSADISLHTTTQFLKAPETEKCTSKEMWNKNLYDMTPLEVLYHLSK